VTNQTIIGINIRNIRKSKGITATFMARKLGYKSVSSYLRLENGEAAITLDKGKLIADLLMVDINDFFCEKNLREMRKERKTG
jgi:putative transcriptional regulator